MKKRGVIYSVIALMLCVAVYLNWSYSKTDGVEGDQEAGGKVLGDTVLVGDMEGEATGEDDWTVSVEDGEDYFSAARLSRQQARDEAVSILSTTVSSETATEEAKETANTQILVMAANATIESRIESLVLAKGYRDCVVFINENRVNVIVAKPENGLSDADVAKITDIVIDEADVSAGEIKIIETT